MLDKYYAKNYIEAMNRNTSYATEKFFSSQSFNFMKAYSYYGYFYFSRVRSGSQTQNLNA